MLTVSDCLIQEAKAISAAAKTLDEKQLEGVLELLNHCFENKSKLVVSGVGKSGIVARKIAATFSSVGIMSLYLNPLDALHGDLGIIDKDDVCLLLSYSGETKEILEIMPHLKVRGTKTISIVGNINSSLANESDLILGASVDREVCPLNLAPTASTSVAMAIGDSLAAVWMSRKGISQNDFAFNHPAGSLGKALSLRCKDLMVPIKNLQPVSPESFLPEIISSITKDSMGCCWVKEPSDKKLKGLITDGDLRRSLEINKFEDLGNLKAKDLMTLDPITIDSNILAIEALNLMENNNKKSISVLPVLNSNKEIIGILKLHDLVKAGLSK